MHMQMTCFDYVNDRPNHGGSLAKLATLIKKARYEAKETGATCLLFDNGDTFQGTPLADLLARDQISGPHPMVAAMNALDYDAGGLGNHDFDYGSAHLNKLLLEQNTPIVCSNMISSELKTVKRHVILERALTDQNGKLETFRIGVLSSLPDKTALWNRHQLKDRVEFTPPIPALRSAAADLRAQGVDLVIVLAHMGFSFFDEGPEAQNLVHEVADLEDVDIVIAGHTHLRFPGPDHTGLKNVNTVTGHVHDTPVVQPGPTGNDLGVIDLTLQKTDTTAIWDMAGAKIALWPTDQSTREDAELVACTQSVHDQTRQHLGQQVTYIDKPMHSYFSLCHPSPIPALLAASKHQAIRKMVTGTQYADLPLLAAASAPSTGGFDGPDNFLFLANGKVERRHISGMNPYANHVWAVKTTGAQIRDWLERSALIFNTLAPDAPNQMLINPHIPSFRCDFIYGLSYTIDPSRPPRFDASGQIVPGARGRIDDIVWNNTPLQETQEFLVATTDHRASGGGLFKVFSPDEIVVHGHAPLQEAVMDYLSDPDFDALRATQPWSFPEGIGRTAILLTAPEAEHHLDDIARLKPEVCGQTDEGFLRIRITL
ncbi:2',3'-cyclic-nucleotide 2'-phosphodiesterase [Roseobacter litoralis Och 149]|uniref:2',3'-cyclic-nucleotide 2'-phosphodiesterase n=1 Tax=Roseobacter litoralis (strain ATCC 49566 / DSM 6996 / JCM 21268 / NBRC 15278 / OCh 149) TaxID=391595 RepID=F7ZAB7_ROSLO|nr:2',3'-cyclic-nucleotide 2'-phosphodiesterase [Roseobacter litoralis Och 149]